jgi:hypothetical protein
MRARHKADPSMTPEQRLWFWKGYRLGRMHTGKLVRRLAQHFEDEFAITDTDADAVEVQDTEEQDASDAAGRCRAL